MATERESDVMTFVVLVLLVVVVVVAVLLHPMEQRPLSPSPSNPRWWPRPDGNRPTACVVRRRVCPAFVLRRESA